METALSIASQEEDPLQDTAEGVRAAFGALVAQHSHLVFRIALAITRSPQDAEDVAQETFLELYRGRRWEGIEDHQAYLARVAWRLAVRRRRPRTGELELDDEMAAPEASPEQSAMDAQTEAWLHAAIDGLPEKLRQPLALAALSELKLVEVAAILGLPEGTVRRRIHTARQLLKQQMMERKGGKR
jgi:RNA polymerase sigma-70 factor (ECF subfamily)